MSEPAVHNLERVARTGGPVAPGRGADASLARGLLRSLYATLRVWHRRDVARRQLASLDDRLLRDVGITRAQAVAEAAKPFWRP